MLCCCTAEHVAAASVYYFKYSSVANCTLCIVNLLCGIMLNMTGTVSLCEQQSTAIYVYCMTVSVSSGKKATKIHLLDPSLPSVRPSSCHNWRNDERILMIVDVSDLC